MNRVQLSGALGRDPESKSLNGGHTVVNFSVATNEKTKKGDEYVEVVEWHNCTAWNNTGQFVMNNLKKGSVVFIEGKIKTEKYTDKAGVEKYATKIIVNQILKIDTSRAASSAPPKAADPYDNFVPDSLPF